VQSRMFSEGKMVSLAKLCKWLGVPRRSIYYKPVKRTPVYDENLVLRVKELIEKHPELGYRRVAFFLKENRKKVQRIFQYKGWQVRKRTVGKRPRIKHMKSVTDELNKRWATDLANVWCGRDKWCRLALVIDCYNREIVGWRLSKKGNAKTAEAALEEGLLNRFGCLGRVPGKLTLRSDNGLVFTSKRYTATVDAYGMNQEFITPYTPEQNGMIERFIRTIKEECIWQNHFESITQANNVIGRWIRYYNQQRPHQALGYITPEAFKDEENVA